MFTKAPMWFRSMSPVKYLHANSAFKSKIYSLAQTQGSGSMLCFLGGWVFLFLLLVLLKAYLTVAGHRGEHQVNSALHTFRFFPSLPGCWQFLKDLAFCLASCSATLFCFVLVFLKKQQGLSIILGSTSFMYRQGLQYYLLSLLLFVKFFNLPLAERTPFAFL